MKIIIANYQNIRESIEIRPNIHKFIQQIRTMKTNQDKHNTRRKLFQNEDNEAHRKLYIHRLRIVDDEDNAEKQKIFIIKKVIKDTDNEDKPI